MNTAGPAGPKETDSYRLLIDARELLLARMQMRRDSRLENVVLRLGFLVEAVRLSGFIGCRRSGVTSFVAENGKPLSAESQT